MSMGFRLSMLPISLESYDEVDPVEPQPRLASQQHLHTEVLHMKILPAKP